ncbi:RNA polymerase sigma factor [Catenulispora rubra]|uniref:RNA polymerase sigma factor n=1 Tax=Catenulispora rubra TaxID=280293 RepID=UPI002264A512|nr:sigma factor-like helix-turn-helix DNA-binding protein [Catenulispora rubra]
MRAALVLYYLGGLRVAEVAEALEIPQGTVKARLARGRVALAGLLADTAGTEGWEMTHA